MTIKPEDWLRHPLRFFDVQDLMILSLLEKGISYAEIGKALECSAANITHRKKKYKDRWPDFDCIANKGGRGYKLSPTAKRICVIASEALRMLEKP